MHAVRKVRVGIEKKAYHPGDVLHARVENLGTEEILFDALFRIEPP